jgi:hypothetical protein
MESIMKLAHSEAMLFKFGSGRAQTSRLSVLRAKNSAAVAGPAVRCLSQGL